MYLPWCSVWARLRTLYLRCTKKCGQDQSTLCATFCLLTSLCDTVGAILARQLTIQCRGKPFSYIHLWTRFLSALAGLLYASAIVAHDRQPEYLLQATPWFLISLGRASLDLANSDWVPLTSLSHCKPLRTMTAVSRYMELTVEPVQQAGCSATRLPGDGQTSTGDASLQEPPSYPPIQVIQARVSSGSSSEVSSINSDLEWDPEDVNLERNKNNVESLRSQMHKGSLSPVDLTSDN
ncbi:transmembrane protein 44 [Cricetulus griseus]|uniref:Transmembrane protein 44 n=1 Tax=Cricetulus griseus TaxID=10029 RepID=A0A061I616_CRIGR|nr:transmembrane protein 44 [Cricetulus griseus]